MKRRLLKIVKISATVLAVLIVLLALLAVWAVRRPWPKVDGEIAVAGIGAPVEIVRDRWGVPHLYAETEKDLYFAQGYVHAQDRLWQMEFNRLVARGQLASVLGPSLVETDEYLRTLGLARAAEEDWRHAGPETRRMLDAYAAGVNRFLDTHRDRLPLEFTLLSDDPAPWTPADSLAWGKLMALNLSLNQTYEVLRNRLAEKVGDDGVAALLPPYPADGPVIVGDPAGQGLPAAGDEAPGADDRQARGTDGADASATGAPSGELLARVLTTGGVAWGSNSWVVAGTRTATGKPILANDTHLGLQMPSTWYEIGLHGGGLDVVGFSFPGLPLVVIGQNRRIAWGITNMCSDVQDLYRERLDDPEKPTKYMAAGKWLPLVRIPEPIEVKGGETVDYEVLATGHGPLVDRVMDHVDEPTALAWTAYGHGSRLLDALRGVDRAGSWEELRAALADWEVPSVNFTYADVDGNIGYQGTGRVPVRVPGDEGLVPKPGWTGAFEWQGFIPYDEMPRAFNPPAGYLVTANNRTTGDGYRHFIAWDMADPYRAARIDEVLAANDHVTVDTVRTLQGDVTSIPARVLAARLAALEPAGDREAKALALLDGWDGRVTTDSAAAALYQVWFYQLWPAIFEDELGEELATTYRQLGISQVPVLIALMDQPNSPWFDDHRTPAVEDRDAILRRALDKALDWLDEHTEGGAGAPDTWRWGAFHTMTFAHAPLGSSGIKPLEWIFNSATYPVGGDVFTVDEGMPDFRNPFRMVFGPSQRFIADLGDLSRSLAVNSTGENAQAFHRHREDQVKLWASLDYHPVLAGRDAVEAAAESTLRLVPAASDTTPAPAPADSGGAGE